MLLAGGTSIAQTELTLHTMRTIPQSTYNNPAFIPTYNSYFGLPGISSIYASVYNSGFSYDNVFSRRADDSLVVNLKNLGNSLQEKNYIANEQRVDILSLGSRLNQKMYLSFNISFKNYVVFRYPRDIMALAIEGNRSYVGKTMNFDTRVDATNHLETGLGLSYQANDKLTVGVRLKYLNGIANVSTNQSSISLHVADDWALTASGDVSVSTSGIEKLTRDDYTFSASDISSYFSNSGFAVDIGATYKITDEISVEASIVDLGFVNWKNNVAIYELEKDISEFTWNGLDIQKLVNREEGEESEMDELLDSLQNSLEITETLGGSYSTSIPMRSYISGTYLLPRNAQLSLVLFGERFKRNFQGGLGITANKQVGKILDLSLSYSIRKNTYNSLGTGFSLRLPPFQLYAVSDNVISTLMYPNSTKYVSLRFGLNMVFGWHKTEASIPNSLNSSR